MGANRHENLDERATRAREKIRKSGLLEFGLSAIFLRPALTGRLILSKTYGAELSQPFRPSGHFFYLW